MDLTFPPPKSPLIWAPIPNSCKISQFFFRCKFSPFLSHPPNTFPPRGFSCVKKGSMAWWEGLDEARVLIATEPSKDGNKVEQLLSLRHPKSGNTTCYLCVDGSLQELHWFKQSYGSWFLGDYVCEDGRLYTATPVDPVFVLLPIFEEARMKKNDDSGKFRQVDEIIYVVGYPGYQHLSSVAENCMQVVCDVKVTDAVSIIGEYLKDEPWLKLLCSKLSIDLQDDAKASNSEIHSSPMENSIESFHHEQGKSEGQEKTTKSKRQTKKIKVETNSFNIKDMFSRATRRGK
ncbi:unnamed protein product [Withania somnifera]